MRSNHAGGKSYTTSNSMGTSCSAYTARTIYRPKCSSPSSGHITTSSSCASMDPSMHTPEFEAVTDGCSQQDVFTPVFETEDDKLVARDV